MRIIPRKTKVKMELIKNVYLSDVIFGLIGVAVAIALFTSNFADGLNIPVGLAWSTIIVCMFITTDGIRLYANLGYLFRFFAQQKRYSVEKAKRSAKMEEIIPFVGLYQDRFIDFKAIRFL